MREFWKEKPYRFIKIKTLEKFRPPYAQVNRSGKKATIRILYCDKCKQIVDRYVLSYLSTRLFHRDCMNELKSYAEFKVTQKEAYEFSRILSQMVITHNLKSEEA